MFITLDSAGGDSMLEDDDEQPQQADVDGVHRDASRNRFVNGVEEQRHRQVEEIINTATIRGVFKNSFQITGLTPLEARDLALLLRAGALAAPVYKIDERTIGPSLGQDNIDRGFNAIQIGFLAVIVFMAIYYRGSA